MSSIRANVSESIYSLKQFLGLHESKTGDTQLKFGEASDMSNFKITKDGKLKKRGGISTLIECDGPVNGMWFGTVQGEEMILAAGGNTLWKIYEGEDGLEYEAVGNLCTENVVSFIEFNGNVYIANGEEYLYYDGTILDNVAGYVPVVLIEFKPNGESNTYENINKLTPRRRAWLSPDGTSTSWTIPEEVLSVEYAKLRTDDSALSYTVSGNTITFTTAPSLGTDTVEICYTSPTSYRTEVETMNFGETFSGDGGSRIVLYGDGSAEILYSDIDYLGNPRADYFPEWNEAVIGASNDKVTSIIRYSDQLIAFKKHSAYRLLETTVELDTGMDSIGFNVKNVNRQLGNSVMCKTYLMTNHPVTYCDGILYEWSTGSYYNSNMSYSETNAKDISNNVYYSMANMDNSKLRMFDDDGESELWLFDGNKCLIYNYSNKAFYVYNELPVRSMCKSDKYLMLGLEDGRVAVMSDKLLNDDGVAINAYWESGSYSFGGIAKRKFSMEGWVAYQVNGSNDLTVEMITDTGKHKVKTLKEESVFSFPAMFFPRFTFSTNERPKTARLRIKVKKFCYLKMILRSDDVASTSTVLEYELKVRTGGSNSGTNGKE